MEKYQLYRTAIDALHFLTTSRELGFSKEMLNDLENAFDFCVSELGEFVKSLRVLSD